MEQQSREHGREEAPPHLDRQTVYALTEKFLHQRYGHRSSGRDPQKYKDLALKLVRSDGLVLDIDGPAHHVAAIVAAGQELSA